MENLPLCLVVFILIPVGSLATGTFIDEYGDLRESLVKKNTYNLKVRPANETVINITLDITNLNKLDIGSQTLTSTFLLYMSWIDERLTWPLTTDIDYLIYSIKEIWTPNRVVTNYVNDIGLIGIFDDGPVPLRVSNVGRVVWTLRVATTTTCQADITYYPYDTQTCEVQVMEWAHPINEVYLQPDGIITSSFQSDGEWDLRDTSLETVGLIGAHNATYEKIKYTFLFQRQFQWYIPFMMIPLGVLSLLMPGVFLVPLEAGEKMTYALTVMLSFTVISSFLFQTLPRVSSNFSLLGVYISATTVAGAVMVCYSLWMLLVHHHPDVKNYVRHLPKLDKFAHVFSFLLMVTMMICFLVILNHPDKSIHPLTIIIAVSVGVSVGVAIIACVACIAYFRQKCETNVTQTQSEPQNNDATSNPQNNDTEGSSQTNDTQNQRKPSNNHAESSH